MDNRNGTEMRSLERALAVLTVFSFTKTEMSLKEITEKLNLPKSTVHRILATLQKNNFIEKNEETDTYQLGYKVMELGIIAADCYEIQKVAISEMRNIVKVSQQTSNLYVKQGFERLCIRQMEGGRYIKRISNVGSVRPLYCGAGKVFLAFAKEDFLQEYFENIELTKFTKHTVTSKKTIMKELKEIREQGYTSSLGEYEDATASVAAPIYNFKNEVEAVLTISGPAYEFTPKKISEYKDILIKACSKLSVKLGAKK